MEELRNERTAEYAPGGSALLRAVRKRKPRLTPAEKNASALKATIEKLGKEEATQLSEQFRRLDNKISHQDWETGNGIILSLVRQQCSQNGIKQLLGVGAPRIKRIIEEAKGERPKKRARLAPAHAATKDDLSVQKSGSWRMVFLARTGDHGSIFWKKT